MGARPVPSQAYPRHTGVRDAESASASALSFFHPPVLHVGEVPLRRLPHRHRATAATDCPRHCSTATSASAAEFTSAERAGFQRGAIAAPLCSQKSTSNEWARNGSRVSRQVDGEERAVLVEGPPERLAPVPTHHDGPVRAGARGAAGAAGVGPGGVVTVIVLSEAISASTSACPPSLATIVDPEVARELERAGGETQAAREGVALLSLEEGKGQAVVAADHDVVASPREDVALELARRATLAARRLHRHEGGADGDHLVLVSVHEEEGQGAEVVDRAAAPRRRREGRLP